MIFGFLCLVFGYFAALLRFAFDMVWPIVKFLIGIAGIVLAAIIIGLIFGF